MLISYCRKGNAVEVSDVICPGFEAELRQNAWRSLRKGYVRAGGCEGLTSSCYLT